MDMHRVVKLIRFANTVNTIRNEKNKALSAFSEVSRHIESAHEAREVTSHIINKEVSSEDLHYVLRIGKRYGPGFANRVYLRYMERRAVEEQIEEDTDGPETT